MSVNNSLKREETICFSMEKDKQMTGMKRIKTDSKQQEEGDS